MLRKIVIETQCIDCINDHFWCQFEKIWTFLNASPITFEFQSWHCSDTFRAQKCSPFVLVSKNCHRDTVYRLYKWSFLMPTWKNMKFSEMLQISLEFQSWRCYEPFKLKNVIHSTFFRKIVIETQCIDCGNDHFWCQFDKIWNFLMLLILFEFSIRALSWTF